jgi:hypothetical protein
MDERTRWLSKLAFSGRMRIRSERLEALGHEAAASFLAKEASSVQDAVNRVSSDNDLTPAQAHRVAEQANLHTWEALFGGGADPDASFEPADHAKTAASRRDPVPVRHVNDDYLFPPNVVHVGVVEKVASVVDDYEALNPRADLVARYKDLDAVLTKAASMDVDLRAQWAEVHPHFEDEFLRAVRDDGLPVVKTAKVLADVSGDPLLVAGLVRDLLPRIGDVDADAEMSKLASAVHVDIEHPLVAATVALSKLASGLRTVEKIRELTRTELNETQRQLAEAAHGA